MSLYAIHFDLSASIDRDAVTKSIERSERGPLLAIADKIDVAATASLVVRDRPSRRGETPSVHATGRRSLRTIESAYDPSTHSVIVGSLGFSVGSDGKTVPQRLEFGGRSYMRPQLDKAARGNTIRDAWTGAVS